MKFRSGLSKNKFVTTPELVHRTDFDTRTEAKLAIFEYIAVFYNRWRRHSYLGYISPAEFEAAAITAALAA